MKKILKNNYKDKRGKIVDIFVNNPKDHCTLVTFNKGATRGNHFHKKSTQYSFIISGKLLLLSARVNKNGNLVGKIKKGKHVGIAIDKQFGAYLDLSEAQQKYGVAYESRKIKK